jgi:hypothetical protein
VPCRPTGRLSWRLAPTSSVSCARRRRAAGNNFLLVVSYRSSAYVVTKSECFYRLGLRLDTAVIFARHVSCSAWLLFGPPHFDMTIHYLFITYPPPRRWRTAEPCGLVMCNILYIAGKSDSTYAPSANLHSNAYKRPHTCFVSSLHNAVAIK